MNDDLTEKVTLKDVYAVVSRIEDKFDRRYETLEKKVDELTPTLITRVDFEILKARVSKLEQWRWYIAGVFAVIVAAVLFFGAEIRHAIFGR